VEFQHRAKDSGKIVRGHASSIDYDVEHSMLHLEDNVSFKDERGEWTMDQLDYNIATEAWRGTNTNATLNRPPKEATSPAVESP
jgi:lipopolysaccharide export system protein LptA